MRDASRAKNSTAKAGHGKNPPGLLSSRPPAAEDDTGRAMASETSPRSAAKSIAARSRMLREKGRTRLVNRRPGPPPTWTTAVVSSRPRPEGRRHMPAPRGAGELRPPLLPRRYGAAALFSTHGRERLFRNAAGQADAASLSAHGAEGKGHGGSGSGRGIYLQLSLVHLDDVA